MDQEFTPRDYQVELVNIALNKNSIIFLPTGAGKSYIGLMIMKSLSRSLLRHYGDGGKISIILVNTVTLVDQHIKNICDHTPFTVGQYTGEMNLDGWCETKWNEEFNKYQVIVMTCQIFANLLSKTYIDLNKVNLLIFDECHRAVNDQPMRYIMKMGFTNLTEPPRVIGLTATLLNRNCKPSDVMKEVEALETTFHGQVATVDGLSKVINYSTNPTEKFKIYSVYIPTSIENTVVDILRKIQSRIKEIKVELSHMTLKNHKRLKIESTEYRKLSNYCDDIIYHINTMGAYAGIKLIISYMIKIERQRIHCQDTSFLLGYKYISTVLQYVKELLNNHIKNNTESDQILKYSSTRLLKLFEIFEECDSRNGKLCCIVFTTRRTTAKILSYVLKDLSQCNSKYEHVKPNFIIGFDTNPFIVTREALFNSKNAKQVLNDFRNREINVLVATDIVEEGVDVPRCSLVIEYDVPNNYRGYIQSKGRARHKDSFYYMMVAENETNFLKKYETFQVVERTLNDFLVGKNKMRSEASEADINDMENEDIIPPYYVSGHGSAQVNMLMAISLLCQYCSSLQSDNYTNFAPEWYVEEDPNFLETGLKRVIILLPVKCPIKDIIKGEYMKTVKLAKRAAALAACIELHKIGELDDHLMPRKRILPEEDVQFLFTHYPEVKERFAGSAKNKRLHEKQTPKCLQGQLTPNTNYYLHIIDLHPTFGKEVTNTNSVIYDLYTCSLCFGLLTPNPLPTICEFPIYVSSGTMHVNLKTNQKQIVLSKEDIERILSFHVAIFKNILKTLKSFLIIDKNPKTEVMLLVPINKSTTTIDFDVLSGYKIFDVIEPSMQEKLELNVTNEDYFKNIVCPWHRINLTDVVTQVCFNKDSFSSFPNEAYNNYKSYFESQGHDIVNPTLPLLKVKTLSSNLVLVKPKSTKFKLEKEIYLPPELCIKQEFPGCLWLQATCLPTVVSKIISCLQLEELRCIIANEVSLGVEIVKSRAPIEYDAFILDKKFKKTETVYNAGLGTEISNLPKNTTNNYIESLYPWTENEEPIDIERELDVTQIDIENYEQFISVPIEKSGYEIKNNLRHNKKLPQIDQSITPKPIELIETAYSNNGPELCEIYRAMTSANANDIVNLERLETLGDSFLKLIASVYIMTRFLEYDEGSATSLKGRMVSNKNLYYLAKQKKLSGCIRYSELSPKHKWLPPSFTVPKEIESRIKQKEISHQGLFNLAIPEAEQVSGEISANTANIIKEIEFDTDVNNDAYFGSLAAYIKCEYIGDKNVADAVESLLGVYFKKCGFKGGIKFIEWIGIIPESENLENLLKQVPLNPLLKENATFEDIIFHLPCCETIEAILGYSFKNKAYLLQALTHASYSPNRLTCSYEKLEFVGDAVLDFLITCHIYESCGEHLDPGQLTDLRSALVNNNTFASFLVRHGLHKFLLILNSDLQRQIDKFVEIFKQQDFVINDAILILLEENDVHLAEQVDVPKILGDILEAIAGAIYLDSSRNLTVVWNIFYRIMWKEIKDFSENVPKNIMRRLFESPKADPVFGEPLDTANKKVIVPLQFKLDGDLKLVHGCGRNKAMAKRAAAKIALQYLEK